MTSATLEVRWKTSNFIVDFDVQKREDFGVLLNDVGPFFRIFDPPPSPCWLRLLNRVM
jgi:hypothetical protein